MSKKKRNKGNAHKKPYQSRGELKNQTASMAAETAQPQATPQPPVEAKTPEPVVEVPAPKAEPETPKVEEKPRIKLPEPAEVQFRDTTPAEPILPKLKIKLPSLKLRSIKPQGPKAAAAQTPQAQANLWRSLFGLSIPILSFLLMLALPAAGLAYFFIVTMAYIIYTLALDEVHRDRSAIFGFVKFAAAGALIAGALTLLSHHLPFGVIFPLFPSSVLWMVFGDSDSWLALAGMHTMAIGSNAFLYLLYGCIIHHVRSFFAKKDAP